MSRIFYISLGVILYYPAWIFKGGLSIFETTVLLSILFLAPLLFHIYILRLKEKNYLKSFFLYLAVIFTFSLDQNYGMMNYVNIIPNFFEIKNYALYIYISGLIFLTIICILLFYLILKLKYNGIKILLAFSFMALAVNIFDNRNADYFEKNYFRENNSLTNYSTNSKKTLIIVLDEMSGVNSFESDHVSGKIVRKNLENLYKKWNFDYYTNAYTLSHHTGASLTSLLNFIHDKDEFKAFQENYEKDNEIFEKNKYFLVEFDLNKNLFFDTFQTKDITVFQSMYINYCNHKKVRSCYQYNPFFNGYEYLDGVKNPNLSRVISLWKLQGSIISSFVWRVLRIKLIDSTLEPHGEKMTANHFFSDLYNNILNKSSDLIFAHTLLSHTPYGFDAKCNYDGSRSKYEYKMSIDDKVMFNNIERSCVIKLLDKFFQKLKDNKLFYNLDILVLSDHGSRISKEFIDDSYKSSLFAIKKNNKDYKVFNEKLSIQHLFSKYFNLNHIN